MYVWIMIRPNSNLRLWTMSTFLVVFLVTFGHNVLHCITVLWILAHQHHLLLLLALLMSFELLRCHSLHLLSIFEILMVSGVVLRELLSTMSWC